MCAQVDEETGEIIASAPDTAQLPLPTSATKLCATVAPLDTAVPPSLPLPSTVVCGGAPTAPDITAATTPRGGAEPAKRGQGGMQFFHPSERKHGKALAPQIASKRLGSTVPLEIRRSAGKPHAVTDDVTHATDAGIDPTGHSSTAVTDDGADEGVGVDDEAGGGVADAASRLTPRDAGCVGTGAPLAVIHDVTATPPQARRLVNDTGVPTHMLTPICDKNSYYAHWFDATKPSAVQRVCADYVRGLQWVTKYYFQGIASWAWYSHCDTMLVNVSCCAHVKCMASCVHQHWYIDRHVS